MGAKFLSIRWLFAAITMSVATICMAEVQPWNVVPAKNLPVISQPASRALQPSRELPPLLSAEVQTHDIFRDQPRNLEHLPNSCQHNSGSLCYDYRSGRAVYKPMRKLLPGIPGLTPHNLAVHRDKVVVQYTFK